MAHFQMCLNFMKPSILKREIKCGLIRIKESRSGKHFNNPGKGYCFFYICPMQLLALSVGQHIIEEFKQTTWLEWVGAITGIYCVYLAAVQNIWNWPVAIISVVAYTIVFY